jgi:RNase adaptor protein for sRNA GlmZ degradation
MLTVKINSFSYKKSGIPVDKSENGGGFVFDCRFIYNPGRKPEFKDLTGLDEKVINFLDNDKVMKSFLMNTFDIIEMAIEDYIERNFTDLMVNFGCTGGQHRSVYAAEKLNEHLKRKYNSKIITEILHNDI